MLLYSTIVTLVQLSYTRDYLSVNLFWLINPFKDGESLVHVLTGKEAGSFGLNKLVVNEVANKKKAAIPI